MWKKVSHLREKTCDHKKLDSLNFELSQDHMHIQTCDIGSFDDYLSYLRVPPVNKNASNFKFEYGGYPEIAQKVIEGANITCLNMHVILRWLKTRPV